MKNIFVLLLRYHALLLFVVLEVIGLSLVFNRNSFQRAALLNTTQQVVGGGQNLSYEVRKFLTLGKVNDSLAQEIALLKEQLLEQQYAMPKMSKVSYKEPELYSLLPAKVISNSIDKRNNYITLDIGSYDGVERNMGIISKNGPVGIVKGVSGSFASGISLLHPDFAVSAKIDELNENGLVLWEGGSTEYVSMTNVPSHVNVEKGQTVVVNSYSYIFPEGIPIGVIEEFDLNEGTAFFNIKVKLHNTMRNLDHVFVVKNVSVSDKNNLEESVVE